MGKEIVMLPVNSIRSSKPKNQSRQVARFACQRCEKGQARYRVKTELLGIFVCRKCADKALKMGFPVYGLSLEAASGRS